MTAALTLAPEDAPPRVVRLPIVDVELRSVVDAPGYWVTSDGRVFSDWRRGGGAKLGPRPAFRRQLKASVCPSTGYPRISIARHGSAFVHRLLMDAWIGTRPGLVVRHLDGIKTNNCLHNLRWGTDKENAADGLRLGEYEVGDKHWTRRKPERIARGTMQGTHTKPESRVRGERCHSAKLSETQVKEIRARWQRGGETKRGLAREFGVHGRAIDLIVNGRTWKHLLVDGAA